MERLKESVAWIVSILFIAASLGLVAALKWLPDDFSIFGISPLIGNGWNVSDYLTILSIHFTTVFLTTGLMSMLGSKEEMVYHVDIVHRTLLRPCGRNFRDLSMYAFVTLGVAVAAFACRSAYVVILSALVGTVVISWVFFKMIGIYFGKKSWSRRIFREIVDSDENGYKASLQQLYGVFEKNLMERDVEALSRNLSLLMELKVYYENEHRGYIAKSMIIEIMEQNERKADISAPELYVRILGIFTEDESVRKQRCTSALNSFFMDYIAAHKELAADWRKNPMLRNVFDFSEENPGIKRWIEEIRKQVALLKEDGYSAQDNEWMEGSEVSRFLGLAGEACKARFLATFYDMSVCKANIAYPYEFHAEIEDLVRCDEKRAGDKDLGEDFWYLNGLQGEENMGEVVYMWEFWTEMGLNEALFIQWFPRFVACYGGEKAGKLLQEFFSAYYVRVRGEISLEKRIYGRAGNTFRHAGISSEDPAVYEKMCVCYLQGCAEQVMKGVPGIAGAVAEMVADFWLDAQSYKSSDELPEFYRDSFRHIGNSLLYADDSEASRNYNERPEGMLQFMESLVSRIQGFGVPEACPADAEDQEPSMARAIPIDMENAFGGFIGKLKELCPKHYSEDTVRKVERMIFI